MKIYSLAILASAATALSVATNLSNTIASKSQAGAALAEVADPERECFNSGREEICCQDEFERNVCEDVNGD